MNMMSNSIPECWRRPKVYKFTKLFSKDPDDQMRPLIREIVIAVLEEANNQLELFKSLSHTIDDGEIDQFEYRTLDERYGNTGLSDIYKLTSDKVNKKLVRDTNQLSSILKQAAQEVRTSGVCSTLTLAVQSLILMRQEDNALLQQEVSQKELISELRRVLEKERINNLKNLKHTNAQLQNEKAALEDLIIYSTEEEKYFEKWEKSRIEQNKKVSENKENVHLSTIKNTQNEIELENRIHIEIEKYLEEVKQDYLNDIQYWMKRYDEDIEERDNNILSLNADMEKLQEDHQLLKVGFEEHRLFIEQRLEHKRILKEKEEQELLEIWAATKIQAWWRGTMYRKKLGPYRKKKKKGKGKGKGKGGKKKK